MEPSVPIPNIVDLSTGLTELISLTVPITGTDFSIGPSYTAYWILEFLEFTLVTVGAGADRRITVNVNDGASGYLYSAYPLDQPTGQTRNYLLVPNAPIDFTALHFYQFLPKPATSIFGSTWSIKSAISNLTGTDYFSTVHAIIRYWPVPG